MRRSCIFFGACGTELEWISRLSSDVDWVARLVAAAQVNPSRLSPFVKKRRNVELFQHIFVLHFCFL